MAFAEFHLHHLPQQPSQVWAISPDRTVGVEVVVTQFLREDFRCPLWN